MSLIKEQIFFSNLWNFLYLNTGDFKCHTPQYFEIGSDGTIDCSFPNFFQGVYWYDSPEESASIIVGMETQNSDSFSRNGPGFLNGSYDITNEGYLIIRNVTHVHDRMFKAIIVDENHAISNYVVVVITTRKYFHNLQDCNVTKLL